MSSWRTTVSVVSRPSRRASGAHRGGLPHLLFVVAGVTLALGPRRAAADEPLAPVSPGVVDSSAAAMPASPPPTSAGDSSPTVAPLSAPIIEPPSPPPPPASLPGGPLLAPTVASTAEEPSLPVARPRFTVAAAVGVSVDNAGIADGRNVAIPSFSVQGGIGQDLLGFDARLFASEAAGQFSTPSQVASDRRALVADIGADRQAVDLMLAVHPFARWQRQRLDWSARFVRALTLDVGAAGERVSLGAQTILRVGAVMCAYADLPLTPADATSALNLRLTVRRMIGTRGDVTELGAPRQIGDTRAELLAGLAVVF